MIRAAKTILCLLFLVIGTCAHVIADPYVIPAPPAVTSKAYVLMDFHTGRVLAENRSEEAMAPASLTKIMTAYVVFHELKKGNVSLEDEVLISEKAWKTPGSRSFVEAGKKVPLGVLLKGMIVQSGNDASVALAEHIAGSEETFAELMNQHAAKLGMKNTHFRNCTGLPAKGHLTTAHDLAILTQAVIRDFPDYYGWYSIKEFEYNGIKQYNRNKLLWRDETIDGVKTGYTRAAGYCLVASAKRDGMRLISVVLDAESTKVRTNESYQLLNYGFRFFETRRFARAYEALTTQRIWYGDADQLQLGLKDDLYITLPRGRFNSLTKTFQTPPAIEAPVKKGQEIGSLVISLQNNVVTEQPLVAVESVEEGSLWDQAVDYFKLKLEEF